MQTEPADVDLEVHPLANLFPMMNDEDLDSLKESIQKNGLREPIVIFESKILDGRNRFRALKALNLPVPTTLFEGEDAVQFVADHNLYRRHLKASQKAAIAALLSEFPRGRPKTVRVGGQNEECLNDLEPASAVAQTQDEVAQAFSVSKRLVAAATQLKKKGHPELLNHVKDGKISIESATMISELPKEEQEKILTQPLENLRASVREVRSKQKSKDKISPTSLANQSPLPAPRLAIDLISEAPTSSPGEVQSSRDTPASLLSDFYALLTKIGAQVASSGFDSEEWFIRHEHELPGPFSSADMRSVMGGQGVVEQIIDHVGQNESH